MTERASRFDLRGLTLTAGATRAAAARTADGWIRLGLPILLFGAIFLIAPLASAADYGRAGFYLGGGASYATDLWEDEIEDALDLRVDIEDTFGLNVRGGIRLLSFVAIEAQYEWLDEYKIDVQNIGSKIDAKQQTLTGNLKLYLPLARVQPYVMAGIGFQRFELDATTFAGFGPSRKYDEIALAGRLGVGLDIYFTENVVLFGEAGVVMTDEDVKLPFNNTIDNLYYVSTQLGLMYRF